MSSFNDSLKHIALKELLIVIILLFLLQTCLNYVNLFNFDSTWVYFIIVLFFIYKLKNHFNDAILDFKEVFNTQNLKSILLITVLNIFLSYLCLYIADFILIDFFSFNTLFQSVLGVSLFSIIIISPISEELIFRGVFYNRLNLVIPTIIAILISAILFASLHSFGSLFSSFVFALSMSILYIKTDNIFVPITAHFLNNLIAEVVVLSDKGNILFTNTSVIYIVSVLGVLSFIIILIWIVKQLNTIKD